MINDLKLGLKTLRYAYGLKMSIFSACVCILMGVIYNVMPGNRGKSIFLGGTMLSCAVLMAVQLLNTLNMASLVQASPCKKRLQTSVPAVLSTGGMALLYLAEALILGLPGLWDPEWKAQAGSMLLGATLIMVLLMLYIGVAYKYFLLASLVMFPSMFVMIYTNINGAGIGGMFILLGVDSVPYGAAVLIGLVLIVIGGFAQYLLSLAVYKAPMSRMAQGAMLRKEL